MKSKTGKLTAVFCALTLTLGMAACGTGANKAGAGAGAGSELKDKVTVAVNIQPSTLDVQLTTTSAWQIIMRNVYESLVTLDKNYEVTTALAEKYTTSEDGKTYLFDLRTGVKFQNGKEMTSADVVFTRVCRGIGAAHGLEVDVDFAQEYPPMVGSQAGAVAAQKTVTALYGEDEYLELEHAVYGSEDFAYVLKEAGGTFISMGSCAPVDAQESLPRTTPIT